MHLRDLLVGSLLDFFFDFLVDDFFFNDFFDNFFLGFFFDNFFDFFYNLFSNFFCKGLLCSFRKDLLCHNLDGLRRRLGKYLDGASFLADFCLFAIAIVALGVVTLGCANGLVGGCGCGCGSGSRSSRSFYCGFFYHRFFLDNNLFLNDGFFFNLNNLFNNGLFFDNFFCLGLIVIKLPGEVCVCRDDGFILFHKLRYMIGIKLECCRRFFLTQVLANQTTRNQCFGIGKRILLLVVDLFDIDGRKTLLFASSLYQLQCKHKLARRIDLVKERRFGIFLFGTNILTTINRIFQRGGIKCKIQIQRARTNVDFCNLHMLVFVGIGIDCPTHALFGSLVTHECVTNCTVIFFGCGTSLYQLCLTALAITRNDVATGLFIKANNAFITKEVAFVFIVIFFCVGFSFSFVFNIEFILGIDFIRFDFFFLGFSKNGGAFAFFLCRMLNSHLSLHAKLGFEFHELGNRLHHLFGSRAELLTLATLGNGGGVGFFDDFLGGFDNMLFYNGSLSAISGSALGDNGTLNGLNNCLGGILCNNSSIGCLDDFFNNFLFVFLCHNSFFGSNQVRNCFLCRLIALVIILFFESFLLSFISKCSFACSGFLCGSFGSFLLGFLCGNCGCLCLSCRSCCFSRNQQISLGIQNNQKNANDKGTYQRGNGQYQKNQFCRCRYSTKRKRGYGIVRATIAIVFVMNDIFFTTASTTQFADKHTDACNFCAQNTRQQSDGDVANVFHAQSQ